MITLTFSRMTSGPATPETVLYSAASTTLEAEMDPGFGGLGCHITLNVDITIIKSIISIF